MRAFEAIRTLCFLKYAKKSGIGHNLICHVLSALGALYDHPGQGRRNHGNVFIAPLFRAALRNIDRRRTSCGRGGDFPARGVSHYGERSVRGGCIALCPGTFRGWHHGRNSVRSYADRGGCDGSGAFVLRGALRRREDDVDARHRRIL